MRPPQPQPAVAAPHRHPAASPALQHTSPPRRLPNQFTTAKITDPSLNNIVSATLTIPAGWKLQGITMISPCTFSPWPVFRAYSPDGLMQMRIEPVFGWQWHPNSKGTFNSGCANISGQISAAAFLQHYLGNDAGRRARGGADAGAAQRIPNGLRDWPRKKIRQTAVCRRRCGPRTQRTRRR